MNKTSVFIKPMKASYLFVFILILIFEAQCFGQAADQKTIVRIEYFEQLLFGEPKTQLTEKERLAQLEKNLFGVVQHGDMNKRLQAIAKMLEEPEIQTNKSKPEILKDNISFPKIEKDSQPFEGSGKIPVVAPPIAVTNQNKARVVMQQAIEKHSGRQDDEAVQLFKQAVALDPNNADGFFNLGAIAEGRGDFAMALHHYQTALNIKPDDSELRQAVISMKEALVHAQQPMSANTNSRKPLKATVSEAALQMNAANSSVRAQVPVVNVNQRPQSKGKAASKAALGIVLSVGASYALRSSGLHCPICRVLGGL